MTSDLEQSNGTIAVRRAKTRLKPGLTTDFYDVTESGIILRGNMPQEKWLKLAEDAIADFQLTQDTHRAAIMRVGDVLAYGEREWKEEYGQAIDAASKAIRLSMKTLQNAMWVCGSVKPAVRHEMLTLSHHEQVAKLTEEEQVKFLSMADEEELTVAELKKRVKAAHPNPNRKTATRKAIIDLDSEEGLHHAAEKLIEFLTPLVEEIEIWSKERRGRWIPTITRLLALFAPDEEICREFSKELASFLDNPDNGPLKGWTPTRKGKWAKQLNAIAKAARRMGVSSCGNSNAAAVLEGEPEEEPTVDTAEGNEEAGGAPEEESQEPTDEEQAEDTEETSDDEATGDEAE